MENDLFDLYERHGSLVIEVGHNSVADWVIVIYDRKNRSLSDAKVAVHVGSNIRKTAFADAYLKLVDYLSETRGGY